jgi:hypothetical protein
MKDLKTLLEGSILADVEDTLAVNKNDLSKKFNVNVPFKSFEDAILTFEILLNQDAKYIKSDGTITVSSEIKRGAVSNDTFKCVFSNNREIVVFDIDNLCKHANVGKQGKKKFNNIKSVILEIRDCKSHLRFQIKLENDKDTYCCMYFDYLINSNDNSLVDTINLFSHNESADILKMIINKYEK